MHWISVFWIVSIIPVIFCIDGTINDIGIEGAPELQCEPNSLTVSFKSIRPFAGRIFVKGYALHNECVQYGSEGLNHRFSVLFDQCGVRRYREYNGISVAATVIISFHKLFITKVDRAYHLRCFYMEASKTLSQRMDVSMMTTIELVQQTELPECRYEILTGGPTGVPIQFVRVGDIVYHKWSCASEATNLYCMKVHSCIVYDGQGGQSVELIDKDGCAVDPSVLADLDYLGDLMAGQRASVFKFADRSALYFSCQIELLIKDPYGQCSSAKPLCKAEASISVPAISNDDEQTLEEEYSASLLSTPIDDQVGDYPPRINEIPGMSPQSITMRKSLAKGTSNKPYGKNQTALPRSSADNRTLTFNRLLRMRRNVNSKGSNELRPVANVDLPEQSLMVFGIETDHMPTKNELSNVAKQISSNDLASEVCLTTGKMTVISIALAILFCSTLTVLLVIIYRQRSRVDKAYFK